MKKIVILFSANGTNMESIIKRLHNSFCHVSAVITNNKNALGIEKARALGIEPVVIEHTQFASRETFDLALAEEINKYEADLIVLAGFMRILSDTFFLHVRNIINIHPSLLPKYKGVKAFERSYASDDKELGLSVHFVNEELDGGEIILQEKFLKADYVDFEAAQQKLKTLEHDSYEKAIKKVLK